MPICVGVGVATEDVEVLEDAAEVVVAAAVKVELSDVELRFESPRTENAVGKLQTGRVLMLAAIVVLQIS